MWGGNIKCRRLTFFSRSLSTALLASSIEFLSLSIRLRSPSWLIFFVNFIILANRYFKRTFDQFLRIYCQRIVFRLKTWYLKQFTTFEWLQDGRMSCFILNGLLSIKKGLYLKISAFWHRWLFFLFSTPKNSDTNLNKHIATAW